jgi:hypothetical protein
MDYATISQSPEHLQTYKPNDGEIVIKPALAICALYTSISSNTYKIEYSSFS